MPRAAQPVFREAPAVPVGRWRLAPSAIGDHGLRRRPRRWAVAGGGAVTWRSAGERSDGWARVVGTHRGNGATAAINPGQSGSPLNAVSGWKLGLVTDFARFINFEIALLCGGQGAATHVDLLVGSGGTLEEIARPLEGGFVGRAPGLYAQRAAHRTARSLRGRSPCGDWGLPRADRAISGRRRRRPRDWGEARGPRTTQPRPLRRRTRGAA
jgi:hypothetical protein